MADADSSRPTPRGIHELRTTTRRWFSRRMRVLGLLVIWVACARTPEHKTVVALDTKPIERSAAIDRIIGDATVVGLGESVHGVGGFHTAKAWLSKYLVEHHGFRLLLIETPYRPALPATAYVATGAGSTAAACGGFYDIWRSGETNELLEWARQFNQRHPSDPLRVYGFDMMGVVEDMAAVRGPDDACFIPRDLPTFYALMSELYTFEAGRFVPGPRKLTDADAAPCLEVLARAEATNPDPTLAISIANVRAWLTTTLAFSAEGIAGADRTRDPALAANVLRMRSVLGNDARTIVWAHNAHIMKDASRLVTKPERFKAPVMGSFLAKQLGAQYRAIGISARHLCATFPNSAPQCFDAAADTLESRLQPPRGRAAFVDLAAYAQREPIAFSTIHREDTADSEQITFTGYPQDLFDAMLVLADAPAPTATTCQAP